MRSAALWVRIYEPTAAGATTDSLTLNAGDGNHVTLFADDLADRLLLWVQELDEAAGRPPRGTFPLDVIAWLASPPQHYPPDELCRRIVKRLEQAGVTGDLLNRMREHVGGAK